MRQADITVGGWKVITQTNNYIFVTNFLQEGEFLVLKQQTLGQIIRNSIYICIYLPQHHV